jgi:hypothetical protein
VSLSRPAYKGRNLLDTRSDVDLATQQDIARVAKAIEILAQVLGALAKLAAAV